MDLQKYKDQAKNYKRIVGSRYISVAPEEIESRIPSQEFYYVSTKYDGHSSFLCYEKGKPVIFVSPRGKEIIDLDINKKAQELIDALDVDQLMVAGELYLKSEERTRSFNLTKAVTENDPNIRFAVYDLIELNNEFTHTLELEEIVEQIEEFFPKEGITHCVNNKKVESRKDIGELFKENVEINDEEGVVVKTEGATFKVKPKYTFDAVIIGYADSDGDRKGMFRDLLLAFMLPDGSYQLFGHLHHGFNEEDRRAFTDEMKKDIVKSQYIEVARNKTAFHFIKPKHIVEFSCLDVITEDSKGAISKMNLNYDEKLGYTINGKKNSVSMTIPNFIRFRTDKEANPNDIRFSQVNDFVDFSEIEIVSEGDYKKSQLLKRVVYTKESRGSLMVKKLVLIKTNKENSGKYPAYVLHLTDYSSGRKDPLKRDVTLTNDEQQAHELFDEIIAKNIKSGWVLYEK